MPGVAERLEAKHSGAAWLAARKIGYAVEADPVEVCYQRGWTDGLPVTPPTDERVIAMLKGTPRKPDDIVGKMPPSLAECTESDSPSADRSLYPQIRDFQLWFLLLDCSY